MDRVPLAQLEEVDRYILARYAEVGAAHPARLRGVRLRRPIFQALNAFATVDLSAFYDDVSKDRLYTFAPRSRERRSAQTAMYLMADGLTRLLAPILSFTADELWRYLPGAREESVHMALFPTAAELDARRRRPDRRLGPADRRSATRCSPKSSRCARTSRSAARCRRRWSCRRPPAELRAARAVRAATCRCCSSSRRSSCGRRRPTSRRTARRGRASPSSAPAA